MYGYGYRYNSGLVVGAGGGAPFLNTYSTQFDGVDDYVETSGIYSELDGQTKMTFSAWIKPTSATTSVIASVEDSGSTEQFRVVFHGSRYILIRTYTGSGRDTRTANGSITLNVWTHIAFCLDFALSSGTRGKIFINGVDATSADAMNQTSINTSGGALRIGARNVGTLLPFPGLIDEVAIWSGTDQRANISDIYSVDGAVNLSLLSTQPTNWFRMGDNGDYKSPQWLLPSNENKDKVSNYSFEFDGVDDYIELGSLSNLQNATEYSICSWFKTPLNNQYQAIYSWFDGADGYLQLLLINDGSFIVYNYRTSTAYGLSATGLVSANTWYNALVVFDGGGATNADRLKLYLNGSLITLTFTGTIPTQTGTMLQNGLYAGAQVTTSGTFTWTLEGNIDEVSIFNSAISIGDVWDGSGEPIDVSAVSGLTQNYRMGEDASFSGGVWTVPDAVGSNDGTSNAMTIEDRVGDAPNSENNALSYNMDLVDRTTDVPT